jgi:hypothetical protein
MCSRGAIVQFKRDGIIILVEKIRLVYYICHDAMAGGKGTGSFFFSV